MFAIVGENGDVFDGQQQNRGFDELLAQWPVSVDFRSSPQQVIVNQVMVSPSQVARSCRALDVGGDGAGAFNNQEEFEQQCKTYRVNATSHICRCSRFGFVSLISHATQQQQHPAQDMLAQWPTTNQLDSAAVGDSQQQQQSSSSYVGAPGKQQQQSVGIWAAIFIALGLFLLIVFVAAFLINVFIRVSGSQSRLSKKKPCFFFGQHQRDLSGGPTTGPLVDHSLGGGDSLSGATTATGNNGTTQSGSIIGLTQSAYQGYKTHQQLYAAHLPHTMGGMCGGGGARRHRWLQFLNPARWLGLSRGKNHDQMIQHRVIGSSSLSGGTKTPGTMSHKSTTYQNGYTMAGLHHHHHSVVNGANIPLAAPSSSTSSYVSSSAYYEEIGPGNLTKVNANQLNVNPTSRTQTLIDPFKRVDQQQQQQVMGQQAALWIQQPNSYPLGQPNYGPSIQQQQHQMSMLPPAHEFQQQQQQQLQAIKQQIQNNDLSQLQQAPPSSAGSGGSQHSSSSTPRHYLFASPTAVNAYKNSMSQQHQQATTLNHHHHCQQMQFKTNQEQHRFMPN